MTTNTRTYPYKAWTVMPSGKPVEVELVANAAYWGNGTDCRWDRTETGKDYDSTKLSPTKEAAIEIEWNRLNEQETNIAKQLEKIAKKRTVLTRARTEA